MPTPIVLLRVYGLSKTWLVWRGKMRSQPNGSSRCATISPQRLGNLIELLELLRTCTAEDAGTQYTTSAELAREDWQGIVTAACERVGQSLRCLEEFSKLVDDRTSAQFKQLRYLAYDVLAKFELRLLRANPFATASLYVLLDCSLPIDGFVRYMHSLARSGADVIRLRDKFREGGDLVKYARAAAAVFEHSSTWLIINDRVDIAIASGAAGVHIGQEDMTMADVRRLSGQLYVGVSTHNMEQALTAENQGADYIGCGPTFSSPTKSFTLYPGADFIREVSQRIAVPAFAIGGISLDNLDTIIQAGCRRVAVSSAIHASPNPIQAIHEFKRRLSKSG